MRVSRAAVTTSCVVSAADRGSRSSGAQLRGGVPADQIPEGMHPAAAMLQAGKDAAPEAPRAARGGAGQRRVADVPPHPGRVVVSGGMLRPFLAINARPLAVDGAVTIDAGERTLVVEPARDARGYAKVLWSEGHRAQVESQRKGIHGTAPTVWAHGRRPRQDPLRDARRRRHNAIPVLAQRPALPEARRHARPDRDHRRGLRKHSDHERPVPPAQDVNTQVRAT
jgi:hypothetical protein